MVGSVVAGSTAPGGSYSPVTSCSHACVAASSSSPVSDTPIRTGWSPPESRGGGQGGTLSPAQPGGSGSVPGQQATGATDRTEQYAATSGPSCAAIRASTSVTSRPSTRSTTRPGMVSTSAGGSPSPPNNSRTASSNSLRTSMRSEA